MCGDGGVVGGDSGGEGCECKDWREQREDDTGGEGRPEVAEVAEGGAELRRISRFNELRLAKMAETTRRAERRRSDSRQAQATRHGLSRGDEALVLERRRAEEEGVPIC